MLQCSRNSYRRYLDLALIGMLPKLSNILLQLFLATDPIVVLGETPFAIGSKPVVAVYRCMNESNLQLHVKSTGRYHPH